MELTPGRHLQTDRILGDLQLAVATQSGCYGLFIRDNTPSGNRAYLAPEAHVSGNYDYKKDVNFINSSGDHPSSGHDFIVSYGSIDSGVKVAQEFATRINTSMKGFGLEYHDDNSDLTDRFSIHTYDDTQSGILEAFTILRSGGRPYDPSLVSQSGLVGITNIARPSSAAPVLPETIFNVQGSSGCDIRFSTTSGTQEKTSVQLLGNGNTRASGLEISYNPSGDQDLSGNSIIDFSLIRPDGTTGREVGFMSVSESGYVGIGSTKENSQRKFDPHAPLTVQYSGSLSGTVSLREQSLVPAAVTDFGQIYVKPRVVGDQTQSLFFVDDG